MMQKYGSRAVTILMLGFFLLFAEQMDSIPGDTIVEGTACFNRITKSTLMGCLNEPPCCNHITKFILLISGKDTFNLFWKDFRDTVQRYSQTGPDSGKWVTAVYIGMFGKVACPGLECEEVHCNSFFVNRQYKVKGRLMKNALYFDLRDKNYIPLVVQKYELIDGK